MTTGLGRPGHMRDSNGPIYVRSALEHAVWIQFEVIARSFVLVLISRPKLALPPAIVDLFGDEARVKSRVTRAAFEELRSARDWLGFDRYWQHTLVPIRLGSPSAPSGIRVLFIIRRCC